MRQVYALIFAALVSTAVFAQSDRGTVTGTISDPAGAVIANAPIALKNSATGANYEAASTATGNYTIAQLPAGTYEMTVTVPGFKKYVRQNIDVQVAQTLRLDVPLEVGAASESVTVSAEVTLLKTESGEMSHNVATERVNSLPIFSIGAVSGSSGIRNPQAVAQLIPGTFVQQNSNLRVNGAPGNTASYRVEGQDASNGQVPATQAQTQPSVDAIQEVTVQTSNFSAEYGQVGGGFFNYTMKSGTNALHGSAYDYFVNEILNANTPWVNTAKPTARRNNYGFTVGGPIVIPKLYNGHDKSFFFFNLEQFRENQNITNQAVTVPIADYRAGNFTRALTGRNLGTDILGRSILENTIYDPSTQRAGPNGSLVRDPFPGNQVPLSQMDAIAIKVQALIPQPTVTGNPLVNNGIYPYVSQRVTTIPAFKIDHSVSSKAKFRYYWSQTKTASQFSPTLGASDGLPAPITAAIGTFITARVQRLNFDYTLSPTVLLHLGGGYQTNHFTDDAPTLDYDQVKSLGLKGATVQRLFPALQFPATQAQGGMKNMGPNGNRHPLLYHKPTTVGSLTWVKDNHTYKFGGEMRWDSNESTLFTNTNGVYTFSPNQTGLPYLQTSTVGAGSIGFAYASFLLGTADTVKIAPVQSIRLAKKQAGFFAQDTWKITRKATLDYGIRWDYGTYLKEDNGQLAQFSPTTPNPAAGNIPGAVIFEGSGANRCNCNFGNIYKLAFAPRLGLAYQINPKTVLRAGWGIVYAGTGDANGATQGGLTAPQAISDPQFGNAVVTLNGGIPASNVLPFPNYYAGQYPQAGYAGKQAPPVWYDQNAGRPARQNQWSIGLQREITPSVVVEASYVGNRGVWWNSPGLIDVNGLTPQRLATYGLDLNNAADRTILNSAIGTVGAGRFQNQLPFAGFPTTLTVAQALRPFPQFNSIQSLFSPLGSTWYNSLQSKATKRFSHGLSLTSVFTFQKQQAIGSPTNVVIGSTAANGPVNDVFNRAQNKYLSPFDQPFVFNIAATYQVPTIKRGGSMGMRVASWVLREWTVNTFLAYSSGLPIQAPFATNNLQTLLLRNLNSTAGTTATYANRVPGVPLFTKDLNCHCFDPNKEFVLNPAAWSQPTAGQFGTAAAYYGDYRFQRRPQENIGFGRNFRIREKMSFNVRAEWTNIFNRAQMPNPTSVNAAATQTNPTGFKPTGGFGFVNTQTVSATSPRQGTIVARFIF